MSGDRVDDVLLVAAVVKRDVEVAAVESQLDQVTARIDKKTTGAGSDVLERDPGADHAAGPCRVEIVGILMRPGPGVALEVHRLNDHARGAQDRPGGLVQIAVGENFQAGSAKLGKPSLAKALKVEDRIEQMTLVGEHVPLRIAARGLAIERAPIGLDLGREGGAHPVAQLAGNQLAHDDVALGIVDAPERRAVDSPPIAVGAPGGGVPRAHVAASGWTRHRASRTGARSRPRPGLMIAR